MKTGLSSALVVDRNGNVLASSDARPAATLADAERLPLPEGSALVVCRADDEVWSRFAHAFIHEVRSPLNAMALYLELAGTPRGEEPAGRPGPSLEYLLGRVQDQIKRIDGLLGMFGAVWAPKSGEPTDLAVVAASAVPFARHEAFRRGLDLEASVCPNAPVAADGGLVAEALVTLFGAAMQAKAGSRISFGVAVAGSEVVVTLATSPEGFATAAAQRALERAGARVEAGAQGVRAAFDRT